MLNLIYSAIKKRLNDKVAPAYTDWYYGQYEEREMEEGGQQLWDTPALFIEFAPIEWQTLQQSVQASNMRFSVHLADESYHDDDKRMTDPVVDHLGRASNVFKALMNWRCMLSYVPGFEALENTANDRVLMESIVRLSSEPDHNLRRQVVSIQVFTSRIYDYAATPQWETVLATLALDVQKVNQLP